MRIPARISTPFSILAVCGLLCGCSPNKKQQFLKSGDRHFSGGEYKEAAIEYMNALRLDNSDRVAGRKLGLTLFELGDYRNTVRLLRPLLDVTRKQDGEDRELELKLALSYFALRNYAESEPLLVKASEHDPDAAELKIKLGIVFLDTYRPAAARANAEAVLLQEADNRQALLLLANASMSTNDMQDALERLESAKILFQDSPLDEIAAANLHLRGGREAAAEAAFRDAATRHPDSDHAQLALAQYLLRKGDAAGAREAYRRAAELATPTSGTRIQCARYHIDQGEFNIAGAMLGEALSANALHVPALVSMAEIAWKTNDLATCVATLDRVLQIDPGNVQAQFLRANAKLAGDRPQEAMKEFEALTSVHTNALPLQRGLVVAYVRNGKVYNAIEILERVVSNQKPANPDDACRLAELYVRTGQAWKALPILESLKERLPRHERTRVLLAAAYQTTGASDKAVVECRYVADELVPANWTSHYRLGLALQANQKTEAALSAFSKAIDLSTNSTPALIQWVNLERRAGRASNAVARVQAQIRKDPQKPDPWCLLGLTYLADRDDEQAIQALKKSVDLGTRQPSAYMALSRLYMAADRGEDALAQLEQGLKKTPNQPALMMLIASIYSQSGKPEEAARRYEKILGIAPDFVPALNNLACLYQNMGRIEDAWQHALKAQKLAPRDPSVADTLGWIALERGDDLWALSLLQEAAEEAANNPEILYHLGMAQVAVGMEAAALDSFEQALDLGEAFTGIEDARLWSSVLAMQPDAVNAAAMLADLQTIVATHRSNAAAWVRIGRIHALRGDGDAARDAFQKALDARKNYLPAMKALLKLVTSNAARVPGALDLATRAVALAPGDSELMAYRGQLLYAKGDYAQALNSLGKAVQQRASDAGLRLKLAHALHVTGRLSNAGDQLRLALEGELEADARREAVNFAHWIATYGAPGKSDGVPNYRDASVQDPDALPLLMAATAVLRMKGETNQAAALLERIVKHFEAFAWAMLDLADIYSRTADRADRARELALRARRLLADDPDDPESLYLVGRCQFHLGLRSEALSTLNRLIELAPTYPHAAGARAIISELTEAGK